MACDRALLVQAYLDGEVDAERALEVEVHLAGCADCAEQLRLDRALRADLRRAAPYHRAPESLRLMIAELPEDTPTAPRRSARTGRRRAFLAGALGGAASTLAAAVVAFVLLTPGATDLLVEDVATAHMRSLMAGHLIDVQSTDRHTVKPWFDGRVDVSPPVADFSADGFTLVGGRLDYVHGRSVAAVVYRRGKHVINLFSWADGGGALPGTVQRNGYRMLFWRAQGLAFCAVSDVAPADLATFKALVEKGPSSQGRE